MKRFLLLPFLISSVFAQINYIHYVKPLTGTQRMGHTYPGATVPFGMVQLSPDTDTLMYEKNGKYQRENGDVVVDKSNVMTGRHGITPLLMSPNGICHHRRAAAFICRLQVEEE